MKTTKKTLSNEKIKVLGKKQLYDPETDSTVDCAVIQMEDKDFNFEKIWIGHILGAVGEIGNKKMKVLFWLLENRGYDNKITKTVEEMTKEIEVSKNTVIDTLKALEKNKILRRKTGVIQLNPEVIFRGSGKKRINILYEYYKEFPKAEIIPFREEKIKG